MYEIVSGMPNLSSATNFRECEDRNWFKVQAVPVIRFDGCKLFRLPLKIFSRTPRDTSTTG
jgi:hypothetical protein